MEVGCQEVPQLVEIGVRVGIRKRPNQDPFQLQLQWEGKG